MVCTFFGHRDTGKEIKEPLREVLIELIENKNTDMFYVGNNGNFDFYVKEVLKELKEKYKINYYIAMAYMPCYKDADYSDTVYFDELNTVPYKYRIIERNKLMIKKSDIVVINATRIGNSRDFTELAIKQNKRVIKIHCN